MKRAAPALPASVEVQLASLVSSPPHGAGWVYETKYDGYRIVASVNAASVGLATRNGKEFTHRAPSVVSALRALNISAVLDGELVSPARGTASRAGKAGDFQSLQNALREGRTAQLIYFVFDVLWCNGEDLRTRPLLERKHALKQLLRGNTDKHLRLGEHLDGEGDVIFKHACRLGMEGVIAKRADAPYAPGRSKSWLKIKCMGREELVVVGYTPPSGSRAVLGALILATREGGKLRYAGKVGTGFTRTSLLDLGKRLRALHRDRCAIVPAPRGPELRGAVWVEPALVAEISFTEWTDDGRLRHPSFQGLREDKAAKSVKRERPVRV
jgi:bifunctional non-homologous end joining protein LigD